MRRTCLDFWRDTRGAIAINFSISAIALALGAGAAIDYSEFLTVRTRLQSDTDAALLAAVSARRANSSLDEKELGEVARAHLDENWTDEKIKIGAFDFKWVDDKDLDVNEADRDVFSLEVKAELPTRMMKLAGIDLMDLDVRSQAAIGTGLPVEIALVLDNTGSMAGTKIETLKKAAGDMVDRLLDTDTSTAKIAVVPFSDYVNVGFKYRGEWWLSVPDDRSETVYQCTKSKPVVSKSNCRKVDKTGVNDGVPYTYQTEVCDIVYGPEKETCGKKTTTYKWSGCVGSRPYPLNIQDQDYKLTPVPGMVNTACTMALTPLSSDRKELKKQVTAMTASGNTYIPAGLVWGWRVLSGDEPFAQGLSEAESKAKGGIKALVLMTDGENVRSPRYPDHGGSNKALANTLTGEVCTNIKKASIQLYTIAFEVTDAQTRTLLEQCATDSAHYFDASNSAELTAAFDAIADKVLTVYLKK